MFKFLKTAALALMVPVIAISGSAVASAAPTGQVEQGNIYYGKNDTQGGAFGDPVNASPCDVLTLKIQMHNPGPGVLHNVNVKATMPSGSGSSFSSTATVTAPDGDPKVVTDTVAINVSKATKINYVPGSTQLLDANHGVIRTLPDGSLASGVDIGEVGVSTQQKKHVQFKVKLDCTETPPKECPEGTTGTPPNCVTPPTPENPKTPEAPAPAGQAPATIAATGPEAIASGVVGSSALGYGIRRWLMSKAALKAALNR